MGRWFWRKQVLSIADGSELSAKVLGDVCHALEEIFRYHGGAMEDDDLLEMTKFMRDARALGKRIAEAEEAVRYVTMHSYMDLSDKDDAVGRFSGWLYGSINGEASRRWREMLDGIKMEPVSHSGSNAPAGCSQCPDMAKANKRIAELEAALSDCSESVDVMISESLDD